MLVSCSIKPKSYDDSIIYKKIDYIDYSLDRNLKIISKQKNGNIILILLPLSGSNEKIGVGVLNACILAAESLKTIQKNTEFLVIDTTDEKIDKNEIYVNFKDKNLKAIIGPVFQKEAKEYGILFPHVPIFTFSNDISINNNHVFACGLSPQDEIRKIFSYAKSSKINSFLFMLPNGKMGDIILNCIKNELKISSFGNKDEIEIIRYDDISRKNATKCANNSGKMAVFVIDPIIDHEKLKNNIMTFTLSSQALSDLEIWNGSIFAFAESEKLHEFIKKYKTKFNSTPNILDIIGYDLMSAIYEMLKTEEFNPFDRIYHGCMGDFIFRKNKGIRRQLMLFQPE